MLYLIRGLPGSGKSTLARMIYDSLTEEILHYRTDDPYPIHLEADMFFIKNGEYKFDAALLKDAHAWCIANFKNNILKCDVIVSNTFTTNKEMAPYIEFAKRFNIPIQVIECKGDFGTIHGVPQTTITKMRDRWEDLNIDLKAT